MNVSARSQSADRPSEHVVFIGKNAKFLVEKAGHRLAGFAGSALQQLTAGKSRSIVMPSSGGYTLLLLADTRHKNGRYGSEPFRLLGPEALRLIRAHQLKKVVIIPAGADPEEVAGFTEGLMLSGYRFDKYLSKQEAKYPESIEVAGADKKLIMYTEQVCRAVFWCRDLVNEPFSVLNTDEFCSQVEEKFKGTNVKVSILRQSKIIEEGLSGLLAVNRGSADPPAVIHLEYKPLGAKVKPVVLVGKGLMYDTGGINLKTTQGMETMKCDMAGGATVAAVFLAAAECGLKRNIEGIIPVTDNRPGSNSLVPGDIIRYSDGTTVEVLNSDAEGRLILADGLLMARKMMPGLTITIATLTGAAHAAFGKYCVAGMESGARKFFLKMQQCGFRVHERVAGMPFWDDYAELLKSEVADMKNIGGAYAGAITAGKFLEHFAPKPFIHLDIAGPAFSDKADGYRGTGGSGFGVRLLVDFLKQIS